MKKMEQPLHLFYPCKALTLAPTGLMDEMDNHGPYGQEWTAIVHKVHGCPSRP